MRHATETITTVDLGYEQMFVFDGGREARVRVLYGATWLTDEGAGDDVIARGGAEMPLRGGRAVIEALAPTRLEIVEGSGRGALRQAHDLLSRAVAAVRRHAERLHLGGAAAEPNA